jgi:hypothetical protein
MLRPVAPAGPPGGPRIGLGVFLHGEGPAARFGHGGWDEGFVCELVAYPTGGGAAVMTNAEPRGPLIQEVLRGLAAERAWPGFLREPPAAVPVDPAEITRRVGVYETESGARLRVLTDGAGLALHAPPQDPLRLQARSASSFAAEEVDADVTFTDAGLVLRQDGVDQPARRVAADPTAPGV